MRLATYIGGAMGLALLLALVIQADFYAMLHTLRSADWQLLLLVPYRTIFYVLYAAAWLILLTPLNTRRRVGLTYAFWVTALREAIDRLLPVASIGGSVVGIRLMRWRGLCTAPVAASVIMEIMLTLVVSYVFTALGLLLLVGLDTDQEYRRLPVFFLLSLPVPVLTLLLLRYGSVFARVQKMSAPLVGAALSARSAALLDQELRASLSRHWRMVIAGAMQFIALISGAFEIWFALRLFGHPVEFKDAVILESLTLAVRHVAFFVPGGIGVQEAGLILFGRTLGIDAELALAVSMAKRLRELIWGVPALISWQWLEGRRLQNSTAIHSCD